MIICGDLLIIGLFSCFIISAQAGPFGHRSRPRASTVAGSVNEENYQNVIPNDDETSMVDRELSNVNDPEDVVFISSDIVNEDGNLTESGDTANVSEDISNKTSNTNYQKDANSEDLASKYILEEDQNIKHKENADPISYGLNETGGVISIRSGDWEMSSKADEDAVVVDEDAVVVDEDEEAKANEYSREERIVNKAGQARNSINPGSQKQGIMRPQFTNEEPPRTAYYSTIPPRTTYYEYGNPHQILHRAQDRNYDYNVETRGKDLVLQLLVLVLKKVFTSYTRSPSPNLMDMDTDIVLEVELDTTTRNGGGLWNWLLSWFQ